MTDTAGMRMARCATLPALAVTLILALLASFVWAPDLTAQNSNVRPPAGAVVPGGPGASQPERPGNYDVDMWKKLRGGVQGQVYIPDKKAGQLVQSEGESWRNLRNGPLPVYGAYGLAAMVALLAAFFLVRGRIRIDHGWSGRTIERFSNVERMGHWLLATSFIILALTGLNVLYGRYVVLPLVGKEAFAQLAMLGKWLHNYVAFAFMAGLLLTFVLWLRYNFPSWRDIVWIAKGGGMFVKGVHPPSWKFNAGQKILFWLVMLGGVSLSLSGLALMFPFEFPLFAKTFAAIKGLGIGASLPVTLAVTPLRVAAVVVTGAALALIWRRWPALSSRTALAVAATALVASFLMPAIAGPLAVAAAAMVTGRRVTAIDVRDPRWCAPLAPVRGSERASRARARESSMRVAPSVRPSRSAASACDRPTTRTSRITSR